MESRISTRMEWVSGQGDRNIRRVWWCGSQGRCGLRHRTLESHGHYGRRETWSLEVTWDSPVTLMRWFSSVDRSPIKGVGKRMELWKLGQCYKH